MWFCSDVKVGLLFSDVRVLVLILTANQNNQYQVKKRGTSGIVEKTLQHVYSLSLWGNKKSARDFKRCCTFLSGLDFIYCFPNRSYRTVQLPLFLADYDMKWIILNTRWQIDIFTPQSTHICRVQSCVWRLSKYLPPTALSTQRVCPPPAPKAGGTHSPGGGGSIFWKTPDIRLASYSIISLRFTPMLACHEAFLFSR
jgi:hypothetical protein